MSGLPQRLLWHKYIQATTRSQFTTHLRHLNPNAYKTNSNHPDAATTPIAAVQDRVKYWNIVPGDKVRIRGDKTNAVHEVYSINRVGNHVFLRGIKADEDGQSLKPFAYSSLQLFVDDFEFPPKPGSHKPDIVPVFARRVSISAPVWAHNHHRWQWDRFAEATDPPIPNWNKKSKLVIPWPNPAPPPKDADPTPYDTSEADARRVTWVPPHPSTSLSPSVEDAYLESLKEPETYDASLPVEHFLSAELANPHSRAKKQKRWQEKQASYKQLHANMLAEQLASLDGRTRADARAEANWRFRERLIQDKKDDRLRRAISRGALARIEQKKIRRAKKEARRIRRLRETVLVEEENQVVPGTSTVPTP
ncbi:hypothetical protein AURDEDRAFT_141991 [Auricularia subglabra TFB-10046 SS5]|nr:hypothetical protein AURDEDRAFT_141991 [Auricularia subglabra TFB-10046 SS5]